MPRKPPVKSSAPQSTAKTLAVGELRPQPHGGALRNGGTNKGGTGRPPDAFKAMCRALACSAEEAATTVLGNPDHPAFVGALKWASEHGYGKPSQTIEHTGEGGGPVQVQVWKFGTREVTF